MAIAGITIDGNDSTASGGDLVTVSGLIANWTPNAVDGGTLTVDAQVLTIVNSESLTFDGENNGAALTVTGAGQFVHTPANLIDAGNMVLKNLLGVTYTSLGAAGTVTANGTGADTLVAYGTDGSDLIAVTFTAANAIDVDLVNSNGIHVDLRKYDC